MRWRAQGRHHALSFVSDTLTGGRSCLGAHHDARHIDWTGRTTTLCCCVVHGQISLDVHLSLAMRGWKASDRGRKSNLSCIIVCPVQFCSCSILFLFNSVHRQGTVSRLGSKLASHPSVRGDGSPGGDSQPASQPARWWKGKARQGQDRTSVHAPRCIEFARAAAWNMREAPAGSVEIVRRRCVVQHVIFGRRCERWSGHWALDRRQSGVCPLASRPRRPCPCMRLRFSVSVFHVRTPTQQALVIVIIISIVLRGRAT
ncbi:hypothetical protein BDW22DRAFT_1051800 [Trametopsis cervina]|nr:hypothetical protein BDW22DRAFT_1051800 [Trametopsis cervina]